MASAKMNAKSACDQITTHLEFEMTKAELQTFVSQLTDVLGSAAASTFHLQIERQGVAPQKGATAPIAKGNPVTIVVYPFP